MDTSFVAQQILKSDERYFGQRVQVLAGDELVTGRFCHCCLGHLELMKREKRLRGSSLRANLNKQL